MTRTDGPNAPVAAVQNAAVEHALTVGEPKRALALVGALDTVRGSSGDDPALTALAMTLTAWLGLREHDPSFVASPMSPPNLDSDHSDAPASEPSTDRPTGTAATTAADSVHPPVVVGAAIACERFDVALGRAAALAGCSHAAVEGALASRSGNDPVEP